MDPSDGDSETMSENDSYTSRLLNPPVVAAVVTATMTVVTVAVNWWAQANTSNELLELERRILGSAESVEALGEDLRVEISRGTESVTENLSPVLNFELRYSLGRANLWGHYLTSGGTLHRIPRPHPAAEKDRLKGGDTPDSQSLDGRTSGSLVLDGIIGADKLYNATLLDSDKDIPWTKAVQWVHRGSDFAIKYLILHGEASRERNRVVYSASSHSDNLVVGARLFSEPSVEGLGCTWGPLNHHWHVPPGYNVQGQECNVAHGGPLTLKVVAFYDYSDPKSPYHAESPHFWTLTGHRFTDQSESTTSYGFLFGEDDTGEAIGKVLDDLYFHRSERDYRLLLYPALRGRPPRQDHAEADIRKEAANLKGESFGPGWSFTGKSRTFSASQKEAIQAGLDIHRHGIFLGVDDETAKLPKRGDGNIILFYSLKPSK